MIEKTLLIWFGSAHVIHERFVTHLYPSSNVTRAHFSRLAISFHKPSLQKQQQQQLNTCIITEFGCYFNSSYNLNLRGMFWESVIFWKWGPSFESELYVRSRRYISRVNYSLKVRSMFCRWVIFWKWEQCFESMLDMYILKVKTVFLRVCYIFKMRAVLWVWAIF